MKKFSNGGFTLIEIIVVLIIVGILAAIALPSLFSNINKSRAQEAFAGYETYKINLEACLNMHITTESVCGIGGASVVSLPSSTNFTYTQPTTVTNTPTNGTGVSAWPGVAAQATLKNGSALDVIDLSRISSGTYQVTCGGVFIGVC